MKRFVFFSAFALMLYALIASAQTPEKSAEAPQAMSYQGFLTNANGAALADGNYAVTFKLYESVAGGTPLWSETQAVAVSKGMFNAAIGRVSRLNLPFDKTYWLGIAVGSETEMTPRIELTAVAYSMHARSIADNSVSTDKILDKAVTPAKLNAAGAAPGQVLAVTPEGEVAWQNLSSADRGLKLLSPKEGPASTADIPLPVDQSFFTLESVFKLTNIATGSSGIGIWGSQNGSGWGVHGTTPFGIGVYGLHTATTGQNPGVRGGTASNDGEAVGVLGIVSSSTPDAVGAFSAGVRGINNGTNAPGTEFPPQRIGVWGTANAREAYGVYGTSAEGTGVYGEGFTAGVSGTATGGGGRGISGRSTNGIGVSGTGGTAGVEGLTFETTGTGVYGRHHSPTGTAPGVRGETISGSANAAGVLGQIIPVAPGSLSAGVRGINNGTGVLGIGVYGSQAGSGAGVYGTAVRGRGVYGSATSTTGTNYGIYGRTSSGAGYAGYFSGRVHVAGTLSKTSGSFKIDHPLDPANKYLYHSFVESPDMMNIYNGNVMMDGNGEAWVVLPEWFGALNYDFRYQLTAVGTPGPNLYIAQEIKGNRFKIAGGAAGAKISWQVTGIRQDPYAEKYRIPVEEDKPVEERGHFIHPEIYGQPASLSVEAAHEAQPDESKPDEQY